MVSSKKVRDCDGQASGIEHADQAGNKESEEEDGKDLATVSNSVGRVCLSWRRDLKDTIQASALRRLSGSALANDPTRPALHSAHPKMTVRKKTETQNPKP